MRAFVSLQVYRVHGKFFYRNLVFSGGNEHVHLIFETFSLDCHKTAGQQGDRQAAETCLGIGYPDAAEQVDDLPGEVVAKAAAPGNGRIIELAAAKDQLVWIFRSQPGAGIDILQDMLAVTVYGDGAGNVRAVVQDMVESGFQRHSLTEVDNMADDLTAILFFAFPEESAVFYFAAIVCQNDVGKSMLPQFPDQVDHPLIRIQCGNDNGGSFFVGIHSAASHIHHNLSLSIIVFPIQFKSFSCVLPIPYATMGKWRNIMNVSLCVVAYNEEKSLPGLLQDITRQTYPHSQMEIVLVDSCSSDRTREIMEHFAAEQSGDFIDIQIVENPGRIQSCGWNEALVHFTTEVIIRVDAHSHIPKDFVEKNAANLETGEKISGGVRPVLAEEDSGWGRTLLLAEESMFGSSISSFRRKGERAYVKSFFHGAYRREVFERAGGFREDLGRTEDNELHYRLRQCGYRLCMSPDIISYQYIRPTLRRMCRQKCGNGYWVGLTSGVCPGCLSLYHFVPGAFAAGILLTTALALLGFPQLSFIMWGLYWLLAAVMAVLALRGERFQGSFLLLPFLFFLLHISYGAGTLAGLVKMPFWRGAHRECGSVERVKEKMRDGRTTA